jgi:hypothetical protein
MVNISNLTDAFMSVAETDIHSSYINSENAGHNVIIAGEGDDIVFSMGGNSVIDMGEGDDALVHIGDNSAIDMGLGDDNLVFWANHTTIDLGKGDDNAMSLDMALKAKGVSESDLPAFIKENLVTDTSYSEVERNTFSTADRNETRSEEVVTNTSSQSVDFSQDISKSTSSADTVAYSTAQSVAFSQNVSSSISSEDLVNYSSSQSKSQHSETSVGYDSSTSVNSYTREAEQFDTVGNDGKTHTYYKNNHRGAEYSTHQRVTSGSNNLYLKGDDPVNETVTETTTDTYELTTTDTYEDTTTDKYKNTTTNTYEDTKTDTYKNTTTDKYKNTTTNTYENTKTDTYKNTTTDNYENTTTNTYNDKYTDTFKNNYVDTYATTAIYRNGLNGVQITGDDGDDSISMTAFNSSVDGGAGTDIILALTGSKISESTVLASSVFTGSDLASSKLVGSDLIASTTVSELLNSSRSTELVDSKTISQLIGSNTVSELVSSSTASELFSSSTTRELLNSDTVTEFIGSSTLRELIASTTQAELVSSTTDVNVTGPNLQYGRDYTTGSPLILDIDKDGVVEAQHDIGVDVNGDGKADGAAVGGDKMLSMGDIDGDGVITGAEVFGNETINPFTGEKMNAANGFEALKKVAEDAEKYTGINCIENGEVNVQNLKKALESLGAGSLGMISGSNITNLESLGDVKSINVADYTEQEDDGLVQHNQLGSFTDIFGQKQKVDDVWFAL